MSLKIAIMGTRGVPARYGGFETFAEKLSLLLAQKNHLITVYNRLYWGDRDQIFNGCIHPNIKIKYIPTIRHKYLDTPIHALFSFIHSLFADYDAVILCNAANSPFAWIGRIRAPVLINVDGIERKRKKWSWLGKCWYKLGEICSVLFATKVIADAKLIQEYYKKHYNTEAVKIPYGAEAVEVYDTKFISQFGLSKGNYILYVSRLEPENNALGVIEAYGASNADIPLVIVGDAPYATKYKNKLRECASRIKRLNAKKRIVFTGFQFGSSFYELHSNTDIYVQATEVGGIHPALLEAMAYGHIIIANDVPEHREALEDCGLYYNFNDFSDLAKLLDKVTKNKDDFKHLGNKAKQRAQRLFSWPNIADQYEKLLLECVASSDAAQA